MTKTKKFGLRFVKFNSKPSYNLSSVSSKHACVDIAIVHFDDHKPAAEWINWLIKGRPLPLRSPGRPDQIWSLDGSCNVLSLRVSLYIMPNHVNISLGLAPLNSFGWLEHPILLQRGPEVSESHLWTQAAERSKCIVCPAQSWASLCLGNESSIVFLCLLLKVI